MESIASHNDGGLLPKTIVSDLSAEHCKDNARDSGTNFGHVKTVFSIQLYSKSRKFLSHSLDKIIVFFFIILYAKLY